MKLFFLFFSISTRISKLGQIIRLIMFFDMIFDFQSQNARNRKNRLWLVTWNVYPVSKMGYPVFLSGVQDSRMPCFPNGVPSFPKARKSLAVMILLVPLEKTRERGRDRERENEKEKKRERERVWERERLFTICIRNPMI